MSRLTIGTMALVVAGLIAGFASAGDRDDATPTGGGNGEPSHTPTERPVPPSDEAHPLPSDADVLDRIVFGSEPSESNHDLSPETSQLVEDRYGNLGRQILSGTFNDASPGSMSFEMACDPSERTYLTLKIPVNSHNGFNHLQLVDENDDFVGYYDHLGAWPGLNSSLERRREGPPTCADWFHNTRHSKYIYVTNRLPYYLTKGSDTMFLRIANVNNTGDGYPSMPVSRAYTHTGSLFDLPVDEAGEHSHDTGTPAGPTENMDHMIGVTNKQVEGVQKSLRHASPRVLYGLTMAYSRDDWIDAVDKEAIVGNVTRTADLMAFRQAHKGFGAVTDRGWSEHGYLGAAIGRTVKGMKEQGLLSENLGTNPWDDDIDKHPDAPITRREAYIQMLDNAIEWRQKAGMQDVFNQMAFISMSLIRANRALETLGSDKVRSQEKVDHWIDQMLGIKPTGGKGAPWPESGTFHMATEAGITKEPGYGSHYGNLGVHQAVLLAHETGLERVKERAREMVEAFGNLRWFVKGGCGSEKRTVAADAALSCRGYGHMIASRYGGYGYSPLFNAMVLEDEVSKRWAELAIEHDAFSVDKWGGRKNLFRRIGTVEGYRALKDMEESEYTVPMNREQHVWVDVDLGYVHVADGNTRFMTQIPFSANTNFNEHGVHGRASVHYQDPQHGDRIIQADIRRMEYPTNGDTWTRPNHFGNPSHFLSHSPEKEHRYKRYLPWRGEETVVNNAMAGEELPQTCQPNGDSWPGSNGRSVQPDPRVATGIHYRELKLGPYLIGINSTGNEQRGFGPGRDFEMDLPAAEATNLKTGETVTGDTVTVPPRTGVVLKLAE